MDEQITIRSCTLKDADALMSLGIRTFRDTFDEMNTTENMMLYLSQHFTITRIREELREPGSMFFIAEKQNDYIGYARVRTSKKPQSLLANAPIEIERLYVDTKYIGKGIGHLLMRTCLHYAGQHEHDVVWLGVWEHNERALAFYRKYGFEKFGQHIFMLGRDAQTDWLLQKKIA